MNNNNNNTVETFTVFYDGWLNRHQQLQHKLTTKIIDDVKKQHELKKVVEEATYHYTEYYQQKSMAIEDDVFLICSPPWFTSYEQVFFWVSEFPPSLVFRFLNDLNMTAEQTERVNALKVDTGRKELEIGDAMAMVQESLAAAPLYGLVNRAERLVDGEVSELDDAMEEVKKAMRVVVAEADGLRVTAVKEVLEVLDVVQRVKFFATIGEFRIRVRRVGLQMLERGGGTLTL